MTTHLRQSLIEAIKPHEGDTTLHGSNAPEIADEALAVFADWLRRHAMAYAGSLDVHIGITLNSMADSLEPDSASDRP